MEKVFLFFHSSFGVCCVFVVDSDTGTVRENCTYIQSPGFPTGNSTALTQEITVEKCRNGRSKTLWDMLEIIFYIFIFYISHSDVCFLRLDFETFTTQGPLNTLEVAGGACQDTFTIRVSEIL